MWMRKRRAVIVPSLYLTPSVCDWRDILEQGDRIWSRSVNAEGIMKNQRQRDALICVLRKKYHEDKKERRKYDYNNIKLN